MPVEEVECRGGDVEEVEVQKARMRWGVGGRCCRKGCGVTGYMESWNIMQSHRRVGLQRVTQGYRVHVGLKQKGRRSRRIISQARQSINPRG